MQVFSPTGFASGANGLEATVARANPGAARGRALRSMSAAEKLVGGSDCAAASGDCADCATASAQTSPKRPNAEAIETPAVNCLT
jgi:hypothetical protein